MNLDEQDILNDYASRSLRHTADQDYISARMSYKANLVEPFLWSSLHAIEKYFKAILLFNGHTTFRDANKTKGYGHNICELLNAVERIECLDLMLPKQTKTFIKYINEYGENRYFDGSVYLDECALDSLDETVWRIRFHCYYVKYYEEGNYRKIPYSDCEANPKSYKLPDSDAFLEKVVREKLSSYPYLAWNNYFYGDTEYSRDFIKNTQKKFSFVDPPLSYFGIQAYDILKNYVYFPGSVHRHFKESAA